MYSETETGRNPGTISSGLLGAVQANSSEGWRRMVSLYAPLVLYWCRRRGLQPADAEDVIQEVFRAVAARVGRFQRQKPGSFRAWLRGITDHKIADWHRTRLRSGRALSGFDPDRQPIAELGGGQADSSREDQVLYARVIELARAEFEERTWTAFYRVVVDEAPPAEVAAALGMSLNAVYLVKSRILRWARDELSRLIP